MVSTHTLFEWLVGLHIATGAVGLIVVWIPIAARKGRQLHRRARTLFVQSMIATGFTAVAISIMTLSDPTVQTLGGEEAVGSSIRNYSNNSYKKAFAGAWK